MMLQQPIVWKTRVARSRRGNLCSKLFPRNFQKCRENCAPRKYGTIRQPFKA